MTFNKRELFSNYQELKEYWHSPKEQAKITTPIALQEKLIFCTKNLQELYSKGEIKSVDNLPSIETLKQEDPYGVFQLANKMNENYFPLKN